MIKTSKVFFVGMAALTLKSNQRGLERGFTHFDATKQEYFTI